MNKQLLTAALIAGSLPEVPLGDIRGQDERSPREGS